MAPSCRSARGKIAPGRTKAPAGRRGPSRGGTGSDRNDVLRLRALGALGDLELHALVLVQRAVALGRDRRVVDEDVCAAAVLGDEAEALLSVEPLHGTLCHAVSSRGRRATDTVPACCAVVHPTLELTFPGAGALASGARDHRPPWQIRHHESRSTQKICTAAATSMPCRTSDASPFERCLVRRARAAGWSPASAAGARRSRGCSPR